MICGTGVDPVPGALYSFFRNFDIIGPDNPDNVKIFEKRSTAPHLLGLVPERLFCLQSLLVEYLVFT